MKEPSFLKGSDISRPTQGPLRVRYTLAHTRVRSHKNKMAFLLTEA